MEENNIKNRIASSTFLQPHSGLIRVWHWLAFLILTSSMITVLLASTLLHPWKNISLVQGQLKEKGITITADQAFSVTHAYEDEIWDVHKYLGFGLAFLLLSRVCIEITQPGEEKLRSRIKRAIGLYKQDNTNKAEYRHYIGVKTGYLFFYLLILFMAITGLGLAFGHEVSFLGKIHRGLKSIHSIGQYFIYAFILLHLCGVIIADIGRSKNIISGMINGNKLMK
jgi:Ni/Fe-hydrogenase 1 B-type cytochrome subunit